LWHWEWRGVLALVYLAVFGSAIAYTAYAWLMKNARTDRVATFAYVNPAIATVLGWVVLGETLGPLQVAGTIVILLSVALVTWESS
jgi:drug/metabolite transporter (DMT)-like permease